MLVDRHHAQYLIDLGEVAQGRSAEQLVALKDRLDAFLGTLAGAAAPAARRAFEAQMQRLPNEDHPWSAIRRPDPTKRIAADTSTPSSPPAAMLLLAQEDDDPDGDEDGNRIPDAGTPAADPWADLHQALRRWDTAEIQRWAGPLGWQRPSTALALTQEAELVASTSQPAPPPSTPTEAAARAAQEADERSRKTLRAVGIAAAVSSGGALVFGLGRAIANANTRASTSAKDESP